jgi:diguanylate cyclase (GGDEF)-like protein/PAS domain S-box-containing protein
MYGLSPEVVKPGCTFRDLICHRKEVGSFTGDIDEYRSALLSELAQGKATDLIIKTPDGRSIQIVNQPMVDGGWVATHDDITIQRNAEEELDRSRAFLNLIIDNVPATIVVKDARDRRYILINQAGEKYFGVSRDKLIGKTVYEVWPKTTAEMFAGHDEQLLKSDGYLFFDEHSITFPSMGSRIVTSKRLIIRDNKGEPQYLLGVIEDVTERKRLDERIAHMAHHDALTDLPNRLLFHERLEESLKWVHRGEHLALLYLDFDDFKSVNDTLGHTVGDELLKVVATRLRSCLRETDIVARLGGDEFAIIQTAVEQPTDITDLVRRIYEAIREPCEFGGQQIIADASIGIAMAPGDGTEPDQLLKNADLAMYRAKADGRGTYRFFQPEMDARMKARRALEFDLRHAIMCGEFELYYQPIVNFRDNKVTGCEALLRWNHSKRGMISPAEFIPVAEETGLINQLGEWVIKTACAEAANWPDHIRVAINVSPVQFKSQTLALTIINALAASGLPARRLELEITEAVLIRDDAAVLVMLHQLRQLGVRIAMDDFGTGYSSLSYLQRFPFDKIKIDRSFIQDIAEKDGSLTIVQAVINIATSRNITTIAEGVETEEQFKLLRTLGCIEMQGYLFSRPVPVQEILKFFTRRDQKAVDATNAA